MCLIISSLSVIFNEKGCFKLLIILRLSIGFPASVFSRIIFFKIGVDLVVFLVYLEVGCIDPSGN